MELKIKKTLIDYETLDATGNFYIYATNEGGTNLATGDTAPF
jgi:hypothetical protein